MNLIHYSKLQCNKCKMSFKVMENDAEKVIQCPYCGCPKMILMSSNKKPMKIIG